MKFSSLFTVDSSQKENTVNRELRTVNQNGFTLISAGRLWTGPSTLSSGPKGSRRSSDVKAQPIRGFTLIELIVAMMVMGVIAAFITQGMGQYLQRGKDQERKSELAQIQEALTLYYNDSQAYPCADGAYFVGSLTGCGLDSNYIGEMPLDETFGATDCSQYAYVVSGGGQNYELYSKLETDSSLPYTINIGGADCSYNYKIENP